TFFTLVKLPEDRIKSYLNEKIASSLSQSHLTFSVSESQLSILFGISYLMKDVTLGIPSSAIPLRIEQLTFSPSLISLITGRYGGNIKIKNGDGILKASF